MNELGRSQYGVRTALTIREFSRINDQEQRRFDKLLEENGKLFKHEESLAESLSGTLVAGSGPIPPNPCQILAKDGIVVVIGTVGFVATEFPHYVLTVDRVPVIKLEEVKPGVIAPVMDVRDKDGRIVARLEKNGYVIGNHLAVQRPHPSTLIVLDEYGDEAINIQFANEHVIKISGHVDYRGHDIELEKYLGGLTNFCVLRAPNLHNITGADINIHSEALLGSDPKAVQN